MFAKGKTRNETWMMVLEKAFAKVHGSYGAIEATPHCGVAHALHMLTGGDTGSVPAASIQSYNALHSMLQPEQVCVFRRVG